MTTRQPRTIRGGNLVVGEYEPGNGTRYTALAVPVWLGPAQVMGALGFVSDGWLVVSGNSGRASLLQKDGILVDAYIAKHLGGLPGDYPYFGDLIRLMVGRPAPGQGPAEGQVAEVTP